MPAKIIWTSIFFTTFWPKQYYFIQIMDKLYQVVIYMKHENASLFLRLTCLGTLLLLSVALAVTALAQPHTKPAIVPAQVQVQAALPDQLPVESHSFVIRDTQGMVCVYRDDVLIYKTSIPVSSLPEQDRLNLAQGIEVDDEMEMHQLLEDFGA